MNKKFIDMTGQKFGRLTVLRPYECQIKYKDTYWLCECECGTWKVISRGQLMAGETNSCGCLRKEKLQNDRHRNKKLYQAWQDMKQRCYNPKNEYYHRYGGRGITVCNEWLADYKPFYEWAMSHGYKEGLSIDRINNDAGYSPENCRWASPSEQTDNRAVTRKIIIDCTVYTRRDLAELLGVNFERIRRWHEKGVLENMFYEQLNIRQPMDD